MESNNDQEKSNIPTEDNIDMNDSQVDKADTRNGESPDKSTVDSGINEDSDSKGDAKEHSGKEKSIENGINGGSSFDASTDTENSSESSFESSSREISISGEAVMQVIQEFQSITGIEDMKKTRQILNRYNWDILEAISGHLGLDRSIQQIRNRRTHYTFHEDVRSGLNSSAPLTVMCNPCNMRSNSSRGLFRWIWNLVTKPMRFGFEIFLKVFYFGFRFIRADDKVDDKRASTNSVDDVANFISEYEAKYGTDHPVFHQGNFQQAEQDARKELKFLLAYLHCDDHVNCELFCRNVMTSTDFQKVVRKNMLFWGCSTSKLEGIRTYQALGQNKCPFLAMLVLKRNKMSIVRLMEISADPKVIVSMIQSGVVNCEKYLIAEREKRAEIDMTRKLKQRQDESFVRSLQADQEKDRKKVEAMEKLKELELEQQMKIDEEKQRIEEGIQRIKEQKAIAAMNLKSEPALDDPDAIQTLIKLPNGSRLERRFHKTDSLKHLYQFVFSHPESPNTFNICTNFPIRNLPCEPTPDCIEPPSFIEAQIAIREVLFVREIES